MSDDPFSKRSPGQNSSFSTYVVQDRQNEEELMRLAVQDQLLIEVSGGTLAEQEDVKQFKRVLDVSCGTGGWVIETARAYPTMQIIGIDINQAMIDYASAWAEKQGVRERVKFQVMDALALPGLDDASFDLVNLRFGSTYLRVWDWPRLLREIVRVTRPGGTIRLTETGTIPKSNSSALLQMCDILMHSFHAASHLFDLEPAGIVPHLNKFLAEQRCQDIQIQTHAIEYYGGTAMSDAFYEDVKHMFRTFRPFIHKWSKVNKDYDVFYQQMLKDIKQPEFRATVNLSTVWGRTPG